MGGGQLVYVFPFFLGKKEIHKQNSRKSQEKAGRVPGQSRENLETIPWKFVHVSSYLLVFSPALKEPEAARSAASKGQVVVGLLESLKLSCLHCTPLSWPTTDAGGDWRNATSAKKGHARIQRSLDHVMCSLFVGPLGSCIMLSCVVRTGYRRGSVSARNAIACLYLHLNSPSQAILAKARSWTSQAPEA